MRKLTSAKAFFDSTILIYAVSEDPRALMAQRLLEGGGVISVQVLNEFTSVVQRKFQWPWEKIRRTLADLRALCEEPSPITLPIHERALVIAARYRYHIYDSGIVASALHERCSILYSEDMQDGQQIESLTIRNPFKPNIR